MSDPFRDEHAPLTEPCKTCGGTASVTVKHGRTCYAEIAAACHGMCRVMLVRDPSELRGAIAQMIDQAARMPPMLPEFDFVSVPRVKGSVVKRMRKEYERWAECGQTVAIDGEHGIVTAIDRRAHECRLSDRCPS